MPSIPENPPGRVTVPDSVAEIAGDDAITPVWRNEFGGLTFRLENRHGATRYAKWVAAGTPTSVVYGPTGLFPGGSATGVLRDRSGADQVADASADLGVPAGV